MSEYFNEFFIGNKIEVDSVNDTSLSLANEFYKGSASNKLKNWEKLYLSYISAATTNNVSFHQIELVDITFQLEGLYLIINQELDLTIYSVKSCLSSRLNSHIKKYSVFYFMSAFLTKVNYLNAKKPSDVLTDIKI